MIRIIGIVIVGTLIAGSANAATNPQRITAGDTFPIYVNSTGANQSIAPVVYVNQTQVRLLDDSDNAQSSWGR